MDAVLHIEPINRQTSAPLSIGHTDYIFYGEKLTEDGENVGTPTSNLRLGSPIKSADWRLGCPLESVDPGSTQSHVPLVKTIEFMPDYSRDNRHIYMENLYYFKDRKFLFPYRSKIRSGAGQGLRLTHLPTLNMIRSDITGMQHDVCDPRAEIVADIMLKEQMFRNNRNHPLCDFITDDLTTALAKRTTNELTFDTGTISAMVHRYIDQVHHTPSELNASHLKNIMGVVAPEAKNIPPQYNTEDYIGHHILEVRDRLINHGFNFHSLGHIPIDKFEKIEYNPFEFKDVCNLLDSIPLTDFNVDMIVTPEGEISFYHEHFATDRLSVFADHEIGLYLPETILRDCLDHFTVNEIIKKFMFKHRDITPELERIIGNQSVKLKFIKTITDEAAILLYSYDSTSNDPPLCGVYFDIALQSLAPMSIMPNPVIN